MKEEGEAAEEVEKMSVSNKCCGGGKQVVVIREPLRSFGQRCSRLVKEQRAKFYILRRCVTMLVCWQDCADS